MTNITRVSLAVDSNQVKAANAELQRMQKSGVSAQSAVKGIGKALAGLTAGLGIAQAITSTIQKQREFSKSISELSAITGAVGKDLEFYKQQTLEIGRTTTLSAVQASEAFKLIGSAKPELLESKEALAAVTKETVALAEAATMTMPDAARAVAGSLNQFSAGADQVARFVNVLAAGAKYGASEITDTAAAMDKAGSVAAKLGISFEETNAAIQAMAAMNIRAEIAGTGLRSTLIRLATQSKKEFNPEIVGLTKAFQNLAAANLTTTQLTELVGMESITAANAIIVQANAMDGLVKSITGTNVAYEQQSTNTNNLDGDMKRFWNTVEALQLKIGSELDPSLRSAAQAASQFFTVLANNMDTIVDIGKAVAILVGIRLTAWLVGVAAQATITTATFIALNGGMAAAITQAGLLRLALLPLGGPVGAILALAGALGYVGVKIFESGKAAGDAKSGIVHFTGAIEDLDAAGLKLAQNTIALEMQQIADSINRLKTANMADSERVKQMQALGMQYGVLNGKLVQVNGLLKGNETAAGAAAAATEGAGTSTKELTGDLNDTIAALREQLGALGLTDAELVLYNAKLDIAKAKNKELAPEVLKVAAALNAKSEALKVQEDLNKAIDEENKARAGDKKANKELITQMREELELSRMTEKQQYIETAVRRLGTDAVTDQIAEVRKLAAAQFDQMKATELASQQSEPFATAWKSAIKRVDGLFVDLWASLGEGSEAIMDQVKETFKRMLAEMAHAAFTRQIMISLGIGMSGTSTAAQAGSAVAQGGSLVGTIGSIGSSLAGFGKLLSNNGRGFGSILGDFSAGNLAANFAAGYAGNMVGGWASEKWGGGKSGGNVGGTIGGAIGSMLHPIGAFVGSAIGNFVGSFVGAGPSDMAAGGRIDLRNGAQSGYANQTGDKFSQQNVDLRTQVLGQAASFAMMISEFTGKEVKSALAVTIGNRDGLRYSFDGGAVQNAGNSVDALWQGIVKGIIDRSQGLASWIKRLPFEKMVVSIQGLMIANEVNPVLDTLGMKLFPLTQAGANAANAMATLTGGLENFMAGMSNFMDKFAPDDLKLATMKASLQEAFTAVGRKTIPATRDAMWSLMTSLNANTAAGRNQITMLMSVADLADAYYTALETSAANAAQAAEELARARQEDTDNALGALRQSVEESKRLVQEEYTAKLEANQLAVDAAKQGLQAITTETDAIKQALSGMQSGANSGGERASALEVLRNALLTGDLTGTGAAARTASQLNENSYASSEDFRRDQARTMFLLSALGAEGTQQINWAEETVKLLEEERAALDLNYEAEITALESIYQSTLDQVNVLRGIATDIPTITDSLSWLARAILAETGSSLSVPQFAKGGSHKGGLRIVGEDGPELESTGPSNVTSNQALMDALGANQALIEEMRVMRAYMREVSKNTADLRNRVERWNRDGMPEVREPIV